MAKQALARTVEFEPIDRLEEKIKLLVGLVSQLRTEQAQAADQHARLTQDNTRLAQEVEQLRARLAEAEQVNGEVAVLRDERDIIRTRVSEMLQQLEAL